MRESYLWLPLKALLKAKQASAMTYAPSKLIKPEVQVNYEPDAQTQVRCAS